MTMIVIGIDAGLTGALAVLGENRPPDVVDMPTMMKGGASGKVKRELNPAAIAEILRTWADGHADEVMVVLEQQSGRPTIIDGQRIPQGSASVFATGDTYGVLRSVPLVLGMALYRVTAGEWKKHYDLAGGKKNKEHARAKAIGLYPTMPLGHIKDHNRAEALLLARYGWEVLR